MNTFRLILISCILLFVNPVHSADDNGKFFAGGGTGGVKCSHFVAHMENARSYGIDSPLYARETTGFTMFILGFQTGYNYSTPNTFDIFAKLNDHDLKLAWIENYCRANPRNLFFQGVIALAEAFYPDRQRCHSEK